MESEAFRDHFDRRRALCGLRDHQRHLELRARRQGLQRRHSEFGRSKEDDSQSGASHQADRDSTGNSRLPRIARMMATRRGFRLPIPSIWSVALAIVFLAALALRLYGIDWDDGADLHPDELFIAKIVLIDRIRFDWPPDLATLLDPARSGLNPRSADPATGQFREFAYGVLPLWVTNTAAWALSRFTGVDWNAMDRAYLVGRAISAALSALTILPIAALGTSLAGRPVGLMAALFAALAPMSIQLAHFFTTDSWLTCFVALCLLACSTAARDGRAMSFAAAGAAFGLAMATKGSVFALALPIAVALAIHTARRFDHGDAASASRSAFTSALAAGVSAAVTFFA